MESRENRVDSNLDCDDDMVCASAVAGVPLGSLSCNKMSWGGNGEGVVSSMS